MKRGDKLAVLVDEPKVDTILGVDGELGRMEVHVVERLDERCGGGLAIWAHFLALDARELTLRIGRLPSFQQCARIGEPSHALATQVGIRL